MPLDINLFRTEKGNVDKVIESQKRRFAKVEVVQEIEKKDQLWRELLKKLDHARRDVGIQSREIGKKKKAKEDTTELQEQVRKMKDDIKQLEAKVVETKTEVDRMLAGVGNLVHDSVPVSNDEEKDNKVERTHGECKQTGKEKHHHELLYMIDGYSPEPGVAVAGHRGYFLKGPGVMLNQALINYGIAFLNGKGYTPLQPPYFMNKDAMAKTAQLEQFDEELYKVTYGDAEANEEKEKYLIATSEQPISAYHAGQWLQPEELPIKYAGYSTCFRKEAGSHGRDAWGIFRVHQFEKIEQFILTDPEKSWEAHEEMVKTAEEFLKSLGLSYRVVNIVSGELNNAAAKKYDVEAWFPTLGVYRELVSCSNCTDYQSRAMEVRFGQKKMGDREKKYVHMLNSTLCATERTMCCLLENYQTEEGVIVPDVLRPFMGGIEFLPFKRPCPENQNEKANAKKKNKNKKKNKENKQQQK